jgi:protein-tyrosine phosphatase
MTPLNEYNYGPAAECEKFVFGAGKPKLESYLTSQESVQAWLNFMRSNSIQAVCCLLSADQIERYGDLIGAYRKAFGDEHVLWAPIPDFTLVSADILMDNILPFLSWHSVREVRTVVHCSAGSGRTGHVLALWLAHRHGLSSQEAIDAVRHVDSVFRNPLEAIQTAIDRNQLDRLFNTMRVSV